MEHNIMANIYFAALADEVGEISQAAFPSISSLISAILILIIGWIIATQLGKFARNIARRAGLDEIFEKSGVKSFIGRADAKFLISNLLGWVVKWFLILFFITMAVDALNLPEVSQFLFQILNYIPNLVIAIAILTLGLIIAQMAYEALHGMSEASGIRIYHIAGMAVRGLIIIITALVILEQIGVQTTIIEIFAAGFALMLGLAGGLAFGLGGQAHAKELLDEMRGKFRQ